MFYSTTLRTGKETETVNRPPQVAVYIKGFKCHSSLVLTSLVVLFNNFKNREGDGQVGGVRKRADMQERREIDGRWLEEPGGGDWQTNR